MAGPRAPGWCRLLRSVRPPERRRGRGRASFIANFAFGYYSTPHNLTPFGDFVVYLSTNLAQTIDNRGPAANTVTLTPGLRTHPGRDWYFLGAVEVPVTHVKPYDYQVLGALMKVF